MRLNNIWNLCQAKFSIILYFGYQKIIFCMYSTFSLASDFSIHVVKIMLSFSAIDRLCNNQNVMDLTAAV